MKIRQQLNLYRIYPDTIEKIATDEKYKNTLNSIEDKLDFIISRISGHRKPKLLQLKKVSHELFEPYKIRVYFCKVPTDFQWHGFFHDYLKENDPSNKSFLECKKTNHASVLCFVYDDNDIFSFTGGLGSSYVKDFVDTEFGIETLERMSDPETLELRMTKDQSVTGNVSIEQRTYRETQRTFDEDKSGKTYNEVIGSVPYSKQFEKIKNLIFKGSDEKNTNIKAKSSITFSRSLAFSDLKSIVYFFQSLPDQPNFSFSDLKSLKSRRKADKLKIEQLDIELQSIIVETLRAIMKDKKHRNNKLLEISDTDPSFYEASRLVVKRPGNKNIYTFDNPYGVNTNDVLKVIAENDSVYLSEQFAQIKKTKSDAIRSELQSDLASKYSLECYVDTENEKPTSGGKLLEYVSCEVTSEGVPYFQLSNKWYKSNSTYLADLNTRFKEILGACHHTYQFSKWGSGKKNENENTYLNHIATSPPKNTLVFHRVIPAALKLELCDIMHWTAKEINFIHIKPSFDGAVRVLEKQIAHSSKLIGEDLRNEMRILKAYFNCAKNYKGDSPYLRKVAKNIKNESERNFLERIKTKQINFIACIVDPPSNRSITEIEKFESVVAKMSIIEAYRTVRKNATPQSTFRISQIDLK